MKKQASKKQIQKVLDGLIGNIQAIFQRTVNTENVVGLYIEYKGDEGGFNKFIEDRIKKENNDKK